jgi:hypothetical protein
MVARQHTFQSWNSCVSLSTSSAISAPCRGGLLYIALITCQHEGNLSASHLQISGQPVREDALGPGPGAGHGLLSAHILAMTTCFSWLSTRFTAPGSFDTTVRAPCTCRGSSRSVRRAQLKAEAASACSTMANSRSSLASRERVEGTGHPPLARRIGPCSWRTTAPEASPSPRQRTAALPRRLAQGRHWQSPAVTTSSGCHLNFQVLSMQLGKGSKSTCAKHLTLSA